MLYLYGGDRERNTDFIKYIGENTVASIIIIRHKL